MLLNLLQKNNKTLHAKNQYADRLKYENRQKEGNYKYSEQVKLKFWKL